MQLTRQDVVDLLRKAGFADAADDAMHELPDPVEVDYAAEWGQKYGVTRDELISRMGGSS